MRNSPKLSKKKEGIQKPPETPIFRTFLPMLKSSLFSPSLVDLYATLSMGFEPALLQNNSCFTFTSKTINQKNLFCSGWAGCFVIIIRKKTTNLQKKQIREKRTFTIKYFLISFLLYQQCLATHKCIFLLTSLRRSSHWYPFQFSFSWLLTVN